MAPSGLQSGQVVMSASGFGRVCTTAFIASVHMSWHPAGGASTETNNFSAQLHRLGMLCK